MKKIKSLMRSSRGAALIVLGLCLALSGLAVGIGPYAVNSSSRVVTDTTTGLVWQQLDYEQEKVVAPSTWQDALSRCEALTQNGQSDWRLPTYTELISVTDKSLTPAMDPSFTVRSAAYWSSTTYAGNPGHAMYIAFGDAISGSTLKTRSNYARCVRGGPAGPFNYLTVATSGIGGGAVSSNPAGVSCGGSSEDCAEPYTSGTLVTLTAAPNPGSSFTGWSGACTGTGACVVTMSAARDVTATFGDSSAPVDGTLTAAPGNGQITLNWTAATDSLSGLATVNPYKLVKASGSTAPANCLGPAIYQGSALTYNDIDVIVDQTYAYRVCATDAVGNVSPGATAYATVPEPSYAVTVGKAGTGVGTVTSSPAGINCGSDCAETYMTGTPVTLSAVAGPGSSFTGWSGVCTGTGACVLTIDGPKNVTATFADVSPPVPGVVTVTPTSGVWTSASPTITTQFTDGDSPVTACEYSTDSFSAAAGTITGSSPTWTCTAQPTGLSGRRWFDMRATSAGGLGTGLFITRLVDATAPVTSHDAPGGWSTADVTVTLAPVDTESGVATTEYCIDAADSCTPNSSGTSVDVTSEGTRYVRFRSTDAVDNVESTKSAVVRLDKTAPITTSNAPAGWSTSAVTVTLTPSDVVTSVASTEYCVDQVNTCTPSIPGTVVSVTSEGTNYVRFRSADAVGNVESTKSAIVLIDSSAPSVAADKPAGSYFDGVLVTLACSDSVSGCSGIVYTTNGSEPVWPAGGSTLSYAAPITVNSTTTLKFLARDVAGNASSVQSAAYTINPSTVRMAVAMGPGPVNSSEIRVLNSFQTIKSFMAFDGAGVRFGARVAMGDIDDDGASEIIVAKGEGEGNNAEVKIYELDGTPVSGGNVIPFSSAFRYGARVAAGDLNGDGKDEVILGTSHGRSLVRVYSYNPVTRTLADTGLLLDIFGAGADGVNVAASDVDADGKAELIATPASKNKKPEVSVWKVTDASTMGYWTASLHATLGSEAVLHGSYAEDLLQPVTGGGAAVGSDGGSFFVVGSGASGGKFEVYSGGADYDCANLGTVDNISRQKDGIELSVGDVDADGSREIVVTLGANPASDTQVIVYGEDGQGGNRCSWKKDIAPVFLGSSFGARTAVGRSSGL